MIVVLSHAAEADLEQIGDYIARDNPMRAANFVQEILVRCRHLAEMPEACPLVPRYEANGIRRLVHGRYLVFYRVMRDQVQILHILNGAQDYERLLFPDE